jgi:hypothetical protein
VTRTQEGGIGMRHCGKRRVKHPRSGAFDLNDQVADPQFTTTRLGFRKSPSVEYSMYLETLAKSSLVGG